MLYGIYKIKQILDCSSLDFKMKSFVTSENLMEHEVINEILEDYIEMFNMLSEIEEIIDRMVQDGDENKNIDKLMQERNVNQFIDELMQEGEGNEL